MKGKIGFWCTIDVSHNYDSLPSPKRVGKQRCFCVTEGEEKQATTARNGDMIVRNGCVTGT